MKNKDIAKILNITPAAVSMALNNKGGVSEATKRKIMELKYAAPQQETERALKKGSILFSIHKRNGNVISETHFFVTLMSAIQEQAEKYQYFVNILHYDPKVEFHEFMSRVDMSDVKGILVLATEMTSEDAALYRALGKPLVIIDNWFEGEDYDCILMDNVDGIKQAVRYAYQMGHRKIGFVRSKTYLYNFNERFEGFRQGMREVGVPIYKKFIFYTKCTTDGAYEDMREIIKSSAAFPSLLIISNDVMALGIMNALKDAHYQIPRDISIISFDNMPITKYFTPAITSVNIKNEQIGHIAVDRLIEKIEKGRNDYFVHNLIGVNLEIRESVYDLTKLDFS